MTFEPIIFQEEGGMIYYKRIIGSYRKETGKMGICFSDAFKKDEVEKRLEELGLPTVNIKYMYGAARFGVEISMQEHQNFISRLMRKIQEEWGEPITMNSLVESNLAGKMSEIIIESPFSLSSFE